MGTASRKIGVSERMGAVARKERSGKKARINKNNNNFEKEKEKEEKNKRRVLKTHPQTFSTRN